MREKLIEQALSFLKHPNVKNAQKSKQIQFLKKKGLTDEEIDQSYKRLVQKTNPSTSDPTPTSSNLPLATTRNLMNLSRKQLKQLPSIRLFHLQTLVISHNQISSLPPQIGQLVQLNTFQATDNQISNEGLPDEFFDLFQLKNLDLERNKLVSLERFGSLYSLERLNVSYNEIEEISEQFSGLLNLTFIWIQDNKLVKVSQVLSHLPNLRKVLAKNNPITESSQDFGFLKISQI